MGVGYVASTGPVWGEYNVLCGSDYRRALIARWDKEQGHTRVPMACILARTTPRFAHLSHEALDLSHAEALRQGVQQAAQVVLGVLEHEEHTVNSMEVATEAVGLRARTHG